tara:strand:- start:1757 stop:2596 length:840 start_codon:yes stop_codon:yes gene_type:complete
MILRLLAIFVFAIILNSCSKNDKIIYEPQDRINSYDLYNEALKALENNEFFYASKKFSEAELNSSNLELAAKSSIMSAYSLYAINFYDESLDNLDRYLKIYPSDKNVIYAHFLNAVIYFEQISDETKDIEPILKAQEKVNFFLNKYPDTDYAIDLKFKKDLIENQLAAKEMYIAKYYISVKKWIPAINRLKTILEKYNKTIFIEEALHRLVEIHYHIGLKNEAKKYASILGYNYNSGEWFKQSYKVLNKEYKIGKKTNTNNRKKEDNKSFIKKIIKMIK